MDKEIHLRISKELFEELEKTRIEKDYEDKQDLVRDILEEKLFKEKSFWFRLKKLF